MKQAYAAKGSTESKGPAMKSNRIPTVNLIGMVAVRIVGFVLAMLVILFLWAKPDFD